MAVNTSPATQ